MRAFTTTFLFDFHVFFLHFASLRKTFELLMSLRLVKFSSLTAKRQCKTIPMNISCPITKEERNESKAAPCRRPTETCNNLMRHPKPSSLIFLKPRTTRSDFLIRRDDELSPNVISFEGPRFEYICTLFAPVIKGMMNTRSASHIPRQVGKCDECKASSLADDNVGEWQQNLLL